MTKPAIRDRLLNWARYVRVTEKQGISATGQFLEQLKRNAGQWGYEDEVRARVEVDEADGNLVEVAIRSCSPPTKELLKLLYVWNGKVEWVCRRMRIPARPRSIWELRRYHAESEIERILDASDVSNRIVVAAPRREITR